MKDSLQAVLKYCQEELSQMGFSNIATSTALFSTYGINGCLLMGCLGEGIENLIIDAARLVAKKGLGVSILLEAGEKEDIGLVLQNSSSCPKCILNMRKILPESGGPEQGVASSEVMFGASAQLHVTFSGFIAHGSRPDLGINAVDAAALALTAVRSIQLPHHVLNKVQVLSIDAGGSSINMIPDRVTMLLDCTAQSDQELHVLIEKAKTAIELAAQSIEAEVECSVESLLPAAVYNDPVIISALEQAILDHGLELGGTIYTGKHSLQQYMAKAFGCPAACLVMNAEDEPLQSLIAAQVAVTLTKGGI